MRRILKSPALLSFLLLAVLATSLTCLGAGPAAAAPAGEHAFKYFSFMDDPSFTQAVAALSRAKQGGTPRQTNPHPEGSLAWVAWVVARYGGWNCYGKPPGPKTMAKGWERFAATLAGFVSAKADAVV